MAVQPRRQIVTGTAFVLFFAALTVVGVASAPQQGLNQAAGAPTGPRTGLIVGQVVDSTGAPIPGLFQSSAVTAPSTVVFPGGIGQDLSHVFHGNYSTFEGGINFTLPIRNRAAQADSAQALLNERQQKTQYRQQQNAIFVSVRNALIAMQEDRASLAAAEEAVAFYGEIGDETERGLAVALAAEC